LIITLGFIIGSAMVTINNPQISNVATADSATIDSVATIDEPLARVVITTIPNTRVETTAENTVSVTQNHSEKVQETTQNYSEKTQKPTQKSVEKVEETTVEETEQEDTYEEEYLLDIDNPDDSYIPAKINLTDEEVEELARIVEGEFGGGGFIGCALIAQSIRDAMVTFGYSAMEIRYNMQYYGYSTPESIGAYEAIKWIFDGHAVVQHRILVMNNSPGGWHGTQNFVVYYQGVWFYDLW
jgi:hypothetical protein